MNNSYNSLDWKKLPWGIFLFLFTVFAIATPFDFSWPIKMFEGADPVDSTASLTLIERGSLERSIALLSLGVFALLSLLRRVRKRLHINGPLGWLILFYLFWAAFSIFWSNDMIMTIRRVATLILLSFGSRCAKLLHW